MQIGQEYSVNAMNKRVANLRLTGSLICLAPSAVILVGIAVGAALRLPGFDFSWGNDIVFALLVIAVFLPLTRLPMLLLHSDQQALWHLGAWTGGSDQERTAQIEILERRLDALNLEMRQDMKTLK